MIQFPEETYSNNQEEINPWINKEETNPGINDWINNESWIDKDLNNDLNKDNLDKDKDNLEKDNNFEKDLNKDKDLDKDLSESSDSVLDMIEKYEEYRIYPYNNKWYSHCSDFKWFSK